MLISSLIFAVVASASVASSGAAPSQHREIDSWDLKPQSGQVVAGEAYETEKSRTFKLSEGASQISSADKKMRPVTLVSAVTPLLLSAIAGLAFASGGRRYKR